MLLLKWCKKLLKSVYAKTFSEESNIAEGDAGDRKFFSAWNETIRSNADLAEITWQS